MKQYRLIDNLVGWLTFAIAAFVYCSTIEPTASFWDCPEFITTGYKLEVGHPPGAPFFMLTANLFSQFVSDPSQVARMVNTMSALLSATCILFLFWTITHLAKRLVCDGGQPMSVGKLITIEGAGLVGALAYTFSDTFWFSAVEGEVYAYSSAFTAIVFWLILKWEEQADQPHSDRWLVLIAYLTGLSIGVHLLNLLCLPAIVLVYYYKRCPDANLKGSLAALAGSMVLVGAVLYGVVPGIVRVGGWFELLFVNVIGLPFNTGLIIYIVILIATVLWAIHESLKNADGTNHKRMIVAFLAAVALLGIPFYGSTTGGQIGIGIVVLAILAFILFRKYKGKYIVSARVMNTSLLCMLMLMIGYSSYAIIVIRSTANPPMDQNSPEDIFTLGEYLGREQYGTRPLFYGQAYSSTIKRERKGDYMVAVTSKGAPVYQRVEKANATDPDRYKIVRYKDDYEYSQNMLFPRMYSADHAGAYESWLGGVTGHTVMGDNGNMVKMPSQWDNFRFFTSYQLNWMYWRYFMWNFAGRQNDIQSMGELEHGNWITGIPFIDNLRLGDQSKLPDDLKTNKGHNVFYCLPLLLGLLGFIWQAFFKGRTGIKQFWVVFFLFFMTGIAIVIYLNQTPLQPRERDYAYAGSFYAFAIWIGLGVPAIAALLRKAKLNETVAGTATTLACVLIPIQMGTQTWDDHDRSGRFTCRDFGQNYLMSLPEKGNPIIFTNGDNDTFPLWYNQETEGVRTDARVCNLSYLQTDWYIDQMCRPAYDSPSVPITWKRGQYVEGANDMVQIEPEAKNQVLQLYKEQPNEAREAFGDNPFELKNIIEHWILNPIDENSHIIPTDTIVMNIDKEAVRRSGMMIPGDSIPDQMFISLKGRRGLFKSDLMILEMLARTNWERPLYMALTVGDGAYHMDLNHGFLQEGLAYRVTPFNFRQLGMADANQNAINSDKMYDNLMHRFKFGGIENPKVYLDETILRMCMTHRRLFSQLASQLVREGKKDKALSVLDYAAKMIPATTVPHDFRSGSLDIAKAYVDIGQKAKAMTILEAVTKRSEQYLQWYLSLNDSYLRSSSDETMMHLFILERAMKSMQQIDAKKADTLEKSLSGYYGQLQMRGALPQQ